MKIKTKNNEHSLTYKELEVGEVFKELNSIDSKYYFMKVYDPVSNNNLAINLETGDIIQIRTTSLVERINGVFMEGEEI